MIVCCFVSGVTQKESFIDFLFYIYVSVILSLKVLPPLSTIFARLACYPHCDAAVEMRPALHIKFNRLLLFEVKVMFAKSSEKEIN